MTGTVEAWLTGLDAGIEAPVELTPLGNGKSNVVHLVRDASGGRWVLRQPPAGPLAPSAHDVVREHRIMAALAGRAPVPAALGVCTDPAVSEVPLVLLEHLDGLVLDDPEVAARTSTAWRHDAGLAMARALAEVHAVDVEAVGLGDLARHDGYAERQLRRWSRQWDQLESRDVPLVGELARRLGERIPEQREVTLVHGDFHIRNVLFDAETADVRGIVDWELSTLGDPLADVGTLLAYWPRPGDDPLVPSGLSVLDGFPERDELLAAYALASGRDVADVAFWHALAFWKIAVIIEGVRVRALARGVTPSYEAPFVDALLERARQVADRRDG